MLITFAKAVELEKASKEFEKTYEEFKEVKSKYIDAFSKWQDLVNNNDVEPSKKSSARRDYELYKSEAYDLLKKLEDLKMNKIIAMLTQEAIASNKRGKDKRKTWEKAYAKTDAETQARDWYDNEVSKLEKMEQDFKSDAKESKNWISDKVKLTDKSKFSTLTRRKLELEKERDTLDMSNPNDRNRRLAIRDELNDIDEKLSDIQVKYSGYKSMDKWFKEEENKIKQTGTIYDDPAYKQGEAPKYLNKIQSDLELLKDLRQKRIMSDKSGDDDFDIFEYNRHAKPLMNEIDSNLAQLEKLVGSNDQTLSNLKDEYNAIRNATGDFGDTVTKKADKAEFLRLKGLTEDKLKELAKLKQQCIDLDDDDAKAACSQQITELSDEISDLLGQMQGLTGNLQKIGGIAVGEIVNKLTTRHSNLINNLDIGVSVHKSNTENKRAKELVDRINDLIIKYNSERLKFATSKGSKKQEAQEELDELESEINELIDDLSGLSTKYAISAKSRIDTRWQNAQNRNLTEYQTEQKIDELVDVLSGKKPSFKDKFIGTDDQGNPAIKPVWYITVQGQNSWYGSSNIQGGYVTGIGENNVPITSTSSSQAKWTTDEETAKAYASALNPQGTPNSTNNIDMIRQFIGHPENEIHDVPNTGNSSGYTSYGGGGTNMIQNQGSQSIRNWDIY